MAKRNPEADSAIAGPDPADNFASLQNAVHLSEKLPEPIPYPVPLGVGYNENVDVESVFPSPLNPRKHFDMDALRELADSIAVEGVQQPIVVRQRGNEKGQVTGYTYEIVMGERRWRASILAGLHAIPAMVRADLTDIDHLALALTENIKRKDLTPVEQARAYQALKDRGVKVGDIARRAGVDASTISNLVGLLRLPEDVLEMLEEGRISVAMAKALVVNADFPDVVSAAAKVAAEHGWTSKQVENSGGLGNSYQLIQLGAIRKLGDARFKPEDVCTACPYNAMRQVGAGWYSAYCLRPAHFEELQAEAESAIRAEAERAAAEAAARALQEAAGGGRSKAAETLAKVAERQKSPWQQPGGEAAELPEGMVLTGDGMHRSLPGREPAAAGGDAVVEEPAGPGFPLPGVDPLPAAPAVIRIADLKHEEYERVDGFYSCPPGCTKECPCRAQAIGNGDKLIDICLDPARLRVFKAANTREEGKARKKRHDRLRGDVSEALARGDGKGRAAAIVIDAALRNVKADALKAASAVAPAGAAKNVLAQGSRMGLREALAALPVGKAVEIAAAALMEHELLDAYESKSDSNPLVDFYLDADKSGPAGEKAAGAPQAAPGPAGGLFDAPPAFPEPPITEADAAELAALVGGEGPDEPQAVDAAGDSEAAALQPGGAVAGPVPPVAVADDPAAAVEVGGYAGEAAAVAPAAVGAAGKAPDGGDDDGRERVECLTCKSEFLLDLNDPGSKSLGGGVIVYPGGEVEDNKGWYCGDGCGAAVVAAAKEAAAAEEVVTAADLDDDQAAEAPAEPARDILKDL